MVLVVAPEERIGGARSGHARFIAPARLAQECAELRARRFLVAGAPPVPLARGRLREAIDEAVEGALAMRGALPPCGSGDADIAPSIRDQVFRAQALGLSGIALAMPPLQSAAGDRGELSASDGTALAAWMEALQEAPIVLLLDEADRAVRLVTPVSLSQLVPEPEVSARAAADPVEYGYRVDSDSIAIDEIPIAEEIPLPPARSPVQEAIAKAAALLDITPLVIAAPERRARAPIAPAPAATPAPASASAPAPAPAPAAPLARPPRERTNEHILSSAERRTFAMELDAARGPKPARVVDQLFTTRYVPLLSAVSRGEADAAVRSVVEGWRTSFEHSYRESFASMRVTGKRPGMVFDAPEIAAKIGRLNGARAVRLLLVDSMSFELGERVMSRLKERVEDRAVCVERQLLWAALPSTTSQQMGLLARGAEGLRDAPPEGDPDPEIARGRAVTTLRRERIGSREVMKLDCVEARLRNAGPPYDERLDAIAEEVAQVVARFMETLQPRTLLFVFGDHGFRLVQSTDGSSTGPATQGGASPEEVLVPGYAWLAGGVH